MKKMILFVAAACLLFAGCGEVGVIGGADGPTQITVSKENGGKSSAAAGTGVRMVKLNGELYYDTGKESDADGRCGVMDGRFTAGESLPCIPVEDNTSNFGAEPEYQLGSEDTIEIPIDGKWMVFQKLEAERDISGYQYCLSLRGAMPNAEGESQFVVLTSDADLDFERASKSLYSSSMKDHIDFYLVHAG